MSVLLKKGKTENILEQSELFRLAVAPELDPKKRAELGQFLTPISVSTFMASLFKKVQGNEVRLLEPGAGVGGLTSAFFSHILKSKKLPKQASVHLFEIEILMLDYLKNTLLGCRDFSTGANVDFSGEIYPQDFIEKGTEILLEQEGLFAKEKVSYTHCIMNPPYKKIKSDSRHRNLLSQVGIDTPNLYTAFLGLAIKLLEDNGELVAIIPRSFCNGVYFKPFRNLFFEYMSLTHIHIFSERTKAFKDDDVLQENIIIHAVKNKKKPSITLTSSSGPSFDDLTYRKVSSSQVVKDGDPDNIIYLVPTEFEQLIVNRMGLFKTSLKELGLDVSTGPVVDFRLRDDIKQEPQKGFYPLIYAGHFNGTYVDWPKLSGKKPNAIRESDKSRNFLMNKGYYVLTKRFSSNEEKKRIVATIYDSERIPGDKVGFENHLNVIHKRKNSVPDLLAKGIYIYLNSTLVDLYFRQFSGHTQVNAADLKMMQFPDEAMLNRLGKKLKANEFEQEKIDQILEMEINKIGKQEGVNPLSIKSRIGEAISLIELLGLPKEQQNERSALTLLALLNMEPEDAWSDAKEPLMGITPIITFIEESYKKKYAPNSRETIRKQTMHQFVEAGVAIENPDKPDRAINSPKWVYQIEPETLKLIKTYRKNKWGQLFRDYLSNRQSLVEQYAKEREKNTIPLSLPDNTKLKLSPGEHSQLIKQIIEIFGPQFAPGAEVWYVGDTGNKYLVFESEKFKKIGLTFDVHGKFPDVILYYKKKKWLLLIESVTSHGPVDSKRHKELARLFEKSKVGIVYVTAFPDRQMMGKYLSQISWETEVWVADAPTHIIHFNGVRFLGPYGS